MEKLDILVLELRHLQQTCIYSLRLPDLSEILQHEEFLLDPNTAAEKWDSVTKNDPRFLEPQSDTLNQARGLAQRHVLLFPDITSTHQPKYTDPDNTEITKRILAKLKNRWINSSWSDSRKDLYAVLAGAQRLKRQIIADRLFLFLEGRQCLFQGAHSTPPDISRSGPQLFILRIGVLSRAHTYLERIGDFQQRMAQHIEAMPAEYPRPSIHRRRVQGVYTHYLVDRVKNIRESMNLLLAQLQREPKPRKHPPIFHRWLHSYSSSQGTFPDEITDSNNSNDSDFEEVDFVRTGYWMPDKPDNQPILAHELAHHAIRQHYDNLLPQTLASAPRKDRFAALMREITMVIEHFRLAGNNEQRPDIKTLIGPAEIACDLLAASTKGISYLYAFFLEVVGLGLEHTLVDQHGYRPHLSVRLELRHNPNAAYARDLRDWYVRGRILVAWLRQTEKQRQTVDDWVLDGVDTVLAHLNSYLDSLIDNPKYKSGEFWETVTDRLCYLVKTSSAAKQTAQWRAARRKDADTETSKDCKQTPHFSRFAAPLPRTLRNMFSRYIEYSDGGNRSSSNPFRTPRDQRSDRAKHNLLFKHVFDIPWQTSLIRSQDFYWVDDPSKDKASQLYREINTDTSLGRRFFLLAVEVDYAVAQPPCERLRTLLRLLQHKSGTPTPDRYLRDWMIAAHQTLEDELKARTLGNSPQQIRQIQCEQGKLIREFSHDFQHHDTEWWERNVGHQYHTLLIPYLSIHAPFGNDSVTESEASQFNPKNDSGWESHWQHREYTRTQMAAKHMDESQVCFGEQLVDLLVSESERTIGTDKDGKQKKTYDPSFEISLMSRMVLATPQFVSDAEKDISPLATTPNEGDIQFGVLGEYDALSLKSNYHPLCRCPIPVYRKNGFIQSRPLFSHRESWLRTRVTCPPPRPNQSTAPLRMFSDDLERKEGVTAFLFIHLTRRFTRMDFLYWIWHWGRLANQFALTEKDDVFLSDGSADIVLVLGRQQRINNSGETRSRPRSLLDIFTLQTLVNDNFMVSRTQLMPTEHCLKLTAMDCPKEDFDKFVVYAEICLDEGRFAESMYQEFLEKLIIALGNHKFDPLPMILRTPGRVDVSIVIEHVRKDCYNNLIETLESKGLQNLIDSYDVFIARRENSIN